MFRSKLVSFCFLISFGAILVKLFGWQIIRGKDLSNQARSQYQSDKLVTAPRGNILAKDGTWLVARGEAWRVFAEIPKLIESPEKTSEKLAPFFIEDLSDKTTLFSEIARLNDLLSKKKLSGFH